MATSTKLLTADRATRAAGLFKALSDPNRLRIVAALAESELCVHEIIGLVEMEQSAVSHQLRVLRQCELVTSRRDGRHIYYALADRHVHELIQAGVEHAAHTRG